MSKLGSIITSALPVATMLISPTKRGVRCTSQAALFGALSKHAVNFDRPPGTFQSKRLSGHRFSFKWRIHTSPHHVSHVLSRSLGGASLGKVFVRAPPEPADA